MKKKTFFLAIGFAASSPLLRHNRYYDIVKFQIDLVILTSSKNFDNRLHNLKRFFLFSRDFVLAFSELFFFRFIYKVTRLFFSSSIEKRGNEERD